ncbi:hypothetical protein ACFYMO_03775 [Streptomyces sp. NPDC007025]|uniref:hypothetical protein n=1 Tax=Streptomyces sp. NPDC007025 TaxID=3364771 RepID=UPI0036A3A7A1
MSEQPWTIDTIAHALPHPELRATFMRDVNLTPVDRLPDVIARWTRFVEQWEASKLGLDQIQSYIRDHGELPPEYRESPEAEAHTDTFLEQLRADAANRRQHGSNAA